MRYPPISKIKGTSMYPLLKEGDRIFLQEIDEVQVGDIVVYKINDDYIIHRIIVLEGDSVITQGDNSYQPDPPVKRAQLLAKVCYMLKGKEKVRLTDLPKRGRCGEDVVNNKDQIFQYLTNQYFKGLSRCVLWITSQNKTIPMGEMHLKMPDDILRQQIPPSDHNRNHSYLAKSLNSIFQYLEIAHHGSGEIVGLLHCFY